MKRRNSSSSHFAVKSSDLSVSLFQTVDDDDADDAPVKHTQHSASNVVVQRDVYDEGCVSSHDYIHVCITLDTVHCVIYLCMTF